MALLPFFLLDGFVKGNSTPKHLSARETRGACDLIKVIGQALVEAYLKAGVTHGARLCYGRLYGQA
jgi:hypothetical protein